MTVISRPRPRTGRGARSLGPGDMANGSVISATNVVHPRTEREWAAWQRKRDRYRLAIGVWAVERAHADPLGFHQRREFVRMIRMLGLTLADDAEAIALHRRTPPAGKRALARMERTRA